MRVPVPAGTSFVLITTLSEELRAREFLSANDWPFHASGAGAGIELIDRSDPPRLECFWIRDDEQTDVGLVRLLDLDDVADGNPEFDLRICEQRRGQGFGTLAVRWLTHQLFTRFVDLARIEGTTRVDNTAMRATFRRCGYVKEAHHRLAWPIASGGRLAAVTYAVIRSDWETGVPTPVPWADEAD